MRAGGGFGSNAPVPSWTALPKGYRILLAANLAFCVAGLFVTTLPSWRMFESIPDPRYVMTDAHGAAVRVEDFMPHDAYSVRVETIVKVAVFICERGLATAPLTVSAGDRRVRIERDGGRCVSREQDLASR